MIRLVAVSRAAMARLRYAAEPQFGPGGSSVCWFTGTPSAELQEFGLCDLETVTNPDGSPGGGAYYYITDAGRRYVGPVGS